MYNPRYGGSRCAGEGLSERHEHGNDQPAGGQSARSWETDQRWAGIKRDYTAEDVIRLRGSVVEEHTLARRGAGRLWELLHTEDAVRALGAITGNQAVQR